VFGSLRAKLIAAFALVIVLSVVLAGIVFAFLVRAYQTQLQLDRLASEALPLAINVNIAERRGATAADLAASLRQAADDYDARIFLVDPSRHIVVDSGGDNGSNLVGQTLPSDVSQRRHLGTSVQLGVLQVAGQPPMTFVAVDPRASGLTRPPAPPASSPTLDTLVLAVPEQQVADAWLQLAPSLFLAAVVALIGSIAVAMVLARSIARPLAKVTQASEQMAKGDFDQYIEVRSKDEVGQLADSFNAMAREVGRSNRAMRDLLANVSHELRTPLTSIEGFAQAMTDGTIKTPDEYQDAARIIGEEADRMRRLVEDLLYLSKIESGQIDIERARLNLPDLLQNCVRQIQLQAESAGLAVEVETAPVPTVLADRHRLQQVFVNLLDNAVKHTPPAGQVQVRTYAVSDRSASDGHVTRSPGWVAVDVHNTGSYIPPSHAERIFERFYQVDSSRSGREEGSGLGLAIVREIVQAHRGHIEVKSDPADGTTFTVYLPAAA
jgi:signal transduction histidine kinase